MKFIAQFALVMLIGLFYVPAAGQGSIPANRVVLNGYVRDSLSGESIIGATISVNGQSKGVASNQYGFYSSTL